MSNKRPSVKDRKRLKDYSKKATANKKLAMSRASSYIHRVPGNPNSKSYYFDTRISDSRIIGPLTSVMATTACNPSTPTVLNSMYHLNPIPQLPGNNGRRDKNIVAKSVAIRALIQNKYPGNLSAALIWDRNREERDTTSFQLGKVFKEGAHTAGYASCDSLTNTDNARRFKILRRWNFPLDGEHPIDSWFVMDEFVRLKDRECSWDTTDTTGAAPTARAGVLIFAIFGNIAAGHADAQLPRLNLSTRFYYDDQNA